MFRGLLVLILLLGVAADAACATPGPSRELRVLFVGNSLTYVNNLPAMLRSLGRAQPKPVRFVTTTHVAPGSTIAEHWDAGHAAASTRAGRWDAIVLQERGGMLACLLEMRQRQAAECRASVRAHAGIAELARATGARVLLLGTWSPEAALQPRLDRATRQLASRIPATVVATGDALHAHARERGYPATFPDGIHPGLPATVIIAARLHAALTGEAPQPADLLIDFALLPPSAPVRPDLPLEDQLPLAPNVRPLLLRADAIAPLLSAAGTR